MDDELETLLRGHYRRAANDVHATPELVERLTAAGRRYAESESERRVRRWVFPVLAAAVTAAVVLTVAVLLWPRPEGRPHPVGPRPVQTSESPPVQPSPMPSKPPQAPGSKAPPNPVPTPPPGGTGTPKPSASGGLPATPPSTPPTSLPGDGAGRPRPGASSPHHRPVDPTPSSVPTARP